MIKIENTDVYGFQHAIRGMRNAFRSWDKSDSQFLKSGYLVGDTDMSLMKKLSKAGSSHAKFRRMIVVYADITAPLYWWKEFDTYKVGTVANSESTMHSIAEKEFSGSDFSTEHLITEEQQSEFEYLVYVPPTMTFEAVIEQLNYYRERYLRTKSKDDWWQLIQLLPSSYNQMRTVMMNYEVLAAIYQQRKGHRLDEWKDFLDWIEDLPYSEVITGNES